MDEALEMLLMSNERFHLHDSSKYLQGDHQAPVIEQLLWKLKHVGKEP